MEPICTGQRRADIESAVVTFSDTGEAHALTTRARSASHFLPRFKVGEYVIQLRLDWSTLDSYGQPMLDADFIDGETGKHRHHDDGSSCDERTGGAETVGHRLGVVPGLIESLLDPREQEHVVVHREHFPRTQVRGVPE